MQMSYIVILYGEWPRMNPTDGKPKFWRDEILNKEFRASQYVIFSNEAT